METEHARKVEGKLYLAADMQIVNSEELAHIVPKLRLGKDAEFCER